MKNRNIFMLQKQLLFFYLIELCSVSISTYRFLVDVNALSGTGCVENMKLLIKVPIIFIIDYICSS